MKAFDLCMAMVMGGILALSAEEKVPSLAEAKAEFQKHDAALNAEYAALKNELPDWKFALVEEDQRDWVDYRDYVAEWPARAKQQDRAESAEYWDMAAGMTAERLVYLKAWRGVGEQGGWGGRYVDGFGGTLEIAEVPEGICFVLDVVRGPTFHLGNIGGLAKVNEGLGHFETNAAGGDKPTWITFLNDQHGDGRIELISANAGEFHGARAYFDATYLRVSLLSLEEAAAVIERARRGGEPE